MNPQEFKRIQEILKAAAELRKLRETLKKMQDIKKQQELLNKFFKTHPFISTLTPADLAFIREKADYDEAAWEDIVKSFQDTGHKDT